MKKLTTMFLIILSISSFGQSQREDHNEIITFKDEEFSFSIRYASSWIKTEPNLTITKLSLRHNTEYADFNVNVIHWPTLEDSTAQSFVEANLENKGLILKRIRIFDPKAALLEAKEITLDGIPSISIVSLQELSIDSKSKKTKRNQIQTLLNGNVYTLTFTYEQKNQTEMERELEKLLDSFKFSANDKTDDLTGHVRVSSANFRSTPDMDGRIIARLPKATRVRLLSDIALGGWMHVEYTNRKGWMHQNTISFPQTIDSPSRSNVTYKRLVLEGIGLISLPSNMEVQSGVYKELSDSFNRQMGQEFSPDRIIFQQKGLNEFGNTGTYARLIFSTTAGNTSDFPRLREPMTVTSKDLLEIDRETKRQMIKEFSTYGLVLIKWLGVTTESVNGMNCIRIKYLRALKDSPPVLVEIYRFPNYDRQHSLTISYRFEDSSIWKKQFDHILNTLEITEMGS